MTVCAHASTAANGNEGAPPPGWSLPGRPPPGCVITADGSYAARLTLEGASCYPERWILDGPEPYAVPLPVNQPEAPGTEVQPLADGQVLIHRVVAGQHTFSLLYPTGPGTGERLLGAVGCSRDVLLRLLPPAPTGDRVFALSVERGVSVVWLVAGWAGGFGRVAEVPGRCSGGVWLDRSGRLLALDRTPDGGPTKTVVVDLARGGELSPLLQITEGSNDRLLLADPDSGLLLICSDAPSPGRERLGWGVLGSTLPARFPECLRPACPVTPFAIQPGQALTPENCAVALRLDGPAGSWVGVWRPADGRIDHVPAPEGWLTGAGWWTRDGVLRLPYATAAVRCGVAWVQVPGRSTGAPPEQTGERRSLTRPQPEAAQPRATQAEAARPVPLQQALSSWRAKTAPAPLVWIRKKQSPVGSGEGVAGNADRQADHRNTTSLVPNRAATAAR